jgi:GNAT superfamily N-acetyltransferase
VRTPARVAELVYAMDSKSIVRKGMRVRIPPRALRIRRATPADARALAEVHVASWRAGYKGIVADEILAAQSADEREAIWDEILADPANAVLVAGEIDGFVAFEPATREIRALYVDPEHFRQGIGSALIEAAHAELDGDTALWVFEANDRALAFYARHGYTCDGATHIHEPTGVAEVRMTRQARE